MVEGLPAAKRFCMAAESRKNRLLLHSRTCLDADTVFCPLNNSPEQVTACFGGMSDVWLGCGEAPTSPNPEGRLAGGSMGRIHCRRLLQSNKHLWLVLEENN